MAEKFPLDDTEFAFDAEWPQEAARGGVDLLDASVGRLSISANGTNLTTFLSDKGDNGDQLTMPLYNVAEWLASNWWSLLFEPRKSDPTDDPADDFEFRSRHWLGMARQGFALPDLWFLPAGDKIDLIAAGDVYLRFARLTFVNSAAESLPLELVWERLHQFVQRVVDRITSEGIRDSDLHDLWARVLRTNPDEEAYCRLVGSLGLSPYEEHPEVDRKLNDFSGRFPAAVVADLCQASDEKNFTPVVDLTERIFEILPKSEPVHIEVLADIELPSDHQAQAWRWGKEAARVARSALSISSTDPQGADAFFEKLKLGGRSIAPSGRDTNTAIIVSGAYDRQDNEMQLVLSEQEEPRRRFAASRAAFLAWAKPAKGARLVTGARTRDQAASRAFAAELLAPIDYLRRRAGSTKTLSTFQINDLAADLNVSPWVVKYQAQNNRLHIFQP
jgi:hypothetical protein